MTLCQGPAVNDKVNKIEVEVDESPMNRTNLSFFYDEDATFVRNKRKLKP